ncbi:acyl-CoA synthetase (AMP-forming)/AMP-acid ligase II [Catenuloplanes nepalensis]|uniref:Acyl-CoA synthetase (AMP-forming)/AMP-acid ligase II n=1 Tax=Catenuloplanes nepalensis TaxID=587533 RepID=A0ABT9MZQ4_9ACTN|nr:class I adenylate-forming enzyme family protein [Catenuloplanes nepalensis]MDP9796491.1 acyl-CoA synthetase (AMP-forming)/AMP-acid ligase II [Catenuloplanes nepalensis]
MLDRLRTALARDSDRPAVLGATLTGRPRVRATRGDLHDLAEGYARALHHRGLRAGDTLGVAVIPGPAALALMLAAHRLGVCTAILDPAAGPDVLLARLRLAAPALIVADGAAQALASWAAPLARRAQLALPTLGDLAPVVTLGRRWPGAAPSLEIPSGGTPPPVHDGDGDAVIVFTSGTTSSPRAVVHGRASLDAGMRAVTELVRPVPGAPVAGGTFFVLAPALAEGAPVAMPAGRPAALARQLARLKPQATYLTPPELRAALDAGTRFTGRVYSGSAPVSAALLSRVRQSGADEAWGVYALTEVFPAAAVESREKIAFASGSGSGGDLLGALLPGVSARRDAGGVLELRAPQMCHRYLGQPPHDWVSTGDLARLEAGRVILSGRAKDMILRAAENIYPGLYEPSLHVPGVALALIVGVPADDEDETVAAVVELEPGASETAVRGALRGPLARMGEARPDHLVFAPVPVSGRSRKPDRAAASALAARTLSTIPRQRR